MVLFTLKGVHGVGRFKLFLGTKQVLFAAQFPHRQGVFIKKADPSVCSTTQDFVCCPLK